MNILYPLSVTKPDWDYVKTAFAECFNSNIDSGIIHHRMRKDLGTYIGCLGLNNDPKTDQRRAARSALTHVSVTFAFRVDFEIMTFLAASALSTTIEQIEDQYFIIATGSLDLWLNAAREACELYQDKELRLLFNKVIIYFDNIGLKQIVNNYEKVSTSDGTFTLNRI